MLKDLETKRYLLRKPKMEDAEDIYEKWGRDAENVAEYQEHNVHKNIVETKAILKGIIIEAETGEPVWLVEDKKTKELIGYIKVLTISEKDKKCEITFYFVEEARDDNSPEEVLKAIINHLLKEKEFETVITKFYDRSKESTECVSKVLENVGMKKEGVLRNRMINSEGKKINKIIYSIIKEEM